MFFAFTAFASCLITGCKSYDNSEGSKGDTMIHKIDRYLDWEDQNGFSGIISVKIKDKPQYTRSFGFANTEANVTITPKTVFDIGSLTKQFTAAAILKLEMEGKLSVNDTLGRFFPQVPNDKEGISLHQLLTHTSGLKKSSGYDYQRTSKKEFLEEIFNSELLHNQESAYSYSHAGYSLLGAVIEEVSGLSYEDYLRKNIFLPAGMESTGYVNPLWEEQQIAHGYRRCRDWGKPMDFPWASDGPYWNLKANGGMLSSSSDLNAWIRNLKTSSVLSEQAREKFFFPHVREGERANSFYSYGWVIAKSSRNTEVIAHNGDNRRFYTDILMYPSEDVTIVLLANLDKPGNENIAFEIAKIIYWPDYEPQVKGSVQQCLDSLPDTRTGIVAGRFLAAIEEEGELSDSLLLDDLFSTYLKNKHTTEHIFEVLNNMKASFSQLDINRVLITDYNIMEINLDCMEGNKRKRLFIRLVFDEEENYLIRMLMYDTRNMS